MGTHGVKVSPGESRIGIRWYSNSPLKKLWQPPSVWGGVCGRVGSTVQVLKRARLDGEVRKRGRNSANYSERARVGQGAMHATGRRIEPFCRTQFNTYRTRSACSFTRLRASALSPTRSQGLTWDMSQLSTGCEGTCRNLEALHGTHTHILCMYM